MSDNDKPVSNIVKLQVKDRFGPDGLYYVMCNCSPEGIPPWIAVRRDAHGQTSIVLLSCPVCERETPVLNGKVEIQHE